SRRRHTRFSRDWSSDVCSSDLTAPGTNGETHFQNVVRQMYPNAEGQAIDETWTAGQTRTYTITGAVPSYVNEDAPTVFLAAFLQIGRASCREKVEIPADREWRK